MQLPSKLLNALQSDFEASQHTDRASWIADVIANGVNHSTQAVMDQCGVTFEQVCAHLYSNG